MLSNNEEENNNECSICFEEYSQDDPAIELHNTLSVNGAITPIEPHSFHFNCIKTHAENRGNNFEHIECPLCREKITKDRAINVRIKNLFPSRINFVLQNLFNNPINNIVNPVANAIQPIFYSTIIIAGIGYVCLANVLQFNGITPHSFY